jgi:hypothetical protein
MFQKKMYLANLTYWTYMVYLRFETCHYIIGS